MATFDSRRKLTGRDLLPAVGAGVGVGLGAGLITAYAVKLFLQRQRISGGAVARAAIEVEPGSGHE